MGLEVILSDSDTSRINVLTYKFEIQYPDALSHDNLKRALNSTLAFIHNGCVSGECSEGAYINRALGEDSFSRMFEISYEGNGKNTLKVSMAPLNAFAGSVGFLIAAIGGFNVTSSLDAYALIAYWDQEIRKGGFGSIGEVLAQKIREITELVDVTVRYQD